MKPERPCSLSGSTKTTIYEAYVHEAAGLASPCQMTGGYSRYQVNVWRGIVCLSSKSADQDCQNGEERDCDKGNLAQPLQQQAVEIYQDTQHEGDVPNLSATKAHNMPWHAISSSLVTSSTAQGVTFKVLAGLPSMCQVHQMQARAAEI